MRWRLLEPGKKHSDRLEHFVAIRALYFDLQVRYDESPDELFNHLFEFLY
jgi:hypothetical protein